MYTYMFYSFWDYHTFNSIRDFHKNLFNRNTLNFKRRFFSRAFELELDSQSRAVLPPLLRELAHIDKDVVSVGMVSRIEIWSRDKWEAVEQDEELPEDEGTSILAGLVL